MSRRDHMGLQAARAAGREWCPGDRDWHCACASPSTPRPGSTWRGRNPAWLWQPGTPAQVVPLLASHKGHKLRLILNPSAPRMTLVLIQGS